MINNNGSDTQTVDSKLIFTAELTNNKDIEVKVFSRYLPILAHAQKMLDLEINKLYIDERLKSIKEPVIKPAHSILDFVRRK